MPELWDGLAQQPVAEPPSLWPNGDRAPLRITVGGPTAKDSQSSYSGLTPELWQALMQAAPEAAPSLWPQSETQAAQEARNVAARRLARGASHSSEDVPVPVESGNSIPRQVLENLGPDYRAGVQGQLAGAAHMGLQGAENMASLNPLSIGLGLGQTALSPIISATSPIGGLTNVITKGFGRVGPGLEQAADRAMLFNPDVSLLKGASLIAGVAPALKAETRAVEGLTGALAPETAPVRGNTQAELAALQKSALTPEEQQVLHTLGQQYPEFRSAAKFLHPTELRPMLTDSNAQQITRLLDVLPNAAEMTSVARMGAPKQGWYRGSTQALIDVFGKDDAPRFAALLAATSPQNSVEMNLLNSLNIWKNWTAAGRPTDPRAIKAIMGQSVTGTRGEESVLGAWVNNTNRALTAEDPLKVTLSGPKVDSFFHNLADDVYRVTNDAWMANVTGMNQDLFRLSPTDLQLARGNPGMSPSYAATSSLVRRAGQRADMLPLEGQETIWSVAKPMMELQDNLGMRARDVVQAGRLTPDVIRGTPDFATLLKDPTNREILERSGYGDQIEKLRPFVNENVMPTLSTADQNNILNVAKRLEELKSSRERESRISTYMVPKREKPDTTIANATYEAIPGRGTGHGEYFIDQPFSTRENLSNEIFGALSDIHGRSILHRDAGFNTLEGRPTTGAYIPPGGVVENQPGRNFPFEVPLQGRDRMMRPNDEKMAEVINTLFGSMTAQRDTPYHAMRPDKSGTNLFIPLDKKAPLAGMQAVAQHYAGEPLAFADTGKGTTVLNFTPNQMARQKADEITQALGGDKFGRARSVTQGDTMAGLGPAYEAGVGSRQVATKVQEQLDRLTPRELANLDSPDFRRAAGDLHDLYERKARTTKGAAVMRPDQMEYLKLLRDKGLAGLKNALGDPKQLLPVLFGLGLTPALSEALSKSSQSRVSEGAL